MAKIVLCILCAILLAASVQGCGFLDIICEVKESIEEAGSKLTDQAKQAFEQAMDHVFDEDISPLLDKVEAAIDAGIDQVSNDVNETINHIESAIETIINDAAQTANALASNLTHDIEEIISRAASAMIQVENTFYKDASHLLTQINQIVQKGQCMEAGGAKQIQDQVYKLLKALNPFYRVSRCWHSLGHKSTMSLEDLTDIQLYNYQKECILLNKITPTTPIEGPGGILETYAQGQLYAAEYYCIGETANAPTFQDVLTKEWLWWGVQYNIWRNIVMTENSSRRTVRDLQGKTKQLKDNPCGTPVECYAQAIKALNEAEQKTLSIQNGLSNLNQTLNASITGLNIDQKQMNASITGLNVNQEQMNASIVKLKANVSSLVSFPCKCKKDMFMCNGTTLSKGFRGYCKADSCEKFFFPNHGHHIP